MIDLKEASPIAMLKQFASYLDAELIEDFGAGKLILDNFNGKGHITLYELFPGFTAWIYNISFENEVKMDIQFSDDRPYYFGYNIAGHQFHKFPGEDEYHKIGQGQDFLLISEPGSSSEFLIPPTKNYKCCYLILNPTLLGRSDLKSRNVLRESLAEIFEDVDGGKRPYRHFGEIDLKVGKYAEILVDNDRTDVVGRLLTEGAISNMLGTQIKAHDLHISTSNLVPELTKKELAKVSDVGDFIQDNISKDTTIQTLSSLIGISPKKLQAGVRFVYGCSVNDLVTGIRMETARELMHSGEMTVSEISYLVGINSRSHFSKLFLKRFGVLPSKYNRTHSKEDLFYEVCYRSFAIEGITDEDIEQILQTSRRNNKELAVTGCLIFHNGVFFQLIEGPQNAILNLYEVIKKDERNFDVRTMWKGSKAKRDFNLWSLAFITDQNQLEINYQGNSSKLNLKHLMGDIEEQSFASHTLWRKVRHLIKENSLVAS